MDKFKNFYFFLFLVALAMVPSDMFAMQKATTRSGVTREVWRDSGYIEILGKKRLYCLECAEEFSCKVNRHMLRKHETICRVGEKEYEKRYGVSYQFIKLRLGVGKTLYHSRAMDNGHILVFGGRKRTNKGNGFSSFHGAIIICQICHLFHDVKDNPQEYALKKDGSIRYHLVNRHYADHSRPVMEQLDQLVNVKNPVLKEAQRRFLEQQQQQRQRLLGPQMTRLLDCQLSLQSELGLGTPVPVGEAAQSSIFVDPTKEGHLDGLRGLLRRDGLPLSWVDPKDGASQPSHAQSALPDSPAPPIAPPPFPSMASMYNSGEDLFAQTASVPGDASGQDSSMDSLRDFLPDSSNLLAEHGPAGASQSYVLDEEFEEEPMDDQRTEGLLTGRGRTYSDRVRIERDGPISRNAGHEEELPRKRQRKGGLNG